MTRNNDQVKGQYLYLKVGKKCESRTLGYAIERALNEEILNGEQRVVMVSLLCQLKLRWKKQAKSLNDNVFAGARATLSIDGKVVARSVETVKCARTVCINMDPKYFNSSTRQMYCAVCARKINRANGVELCKLVEK